MPYGVWTLSNPTAPSDGYQPVAPTLTQTNYEWKWQGGNTLILPDTGKYQIQIAVTRSLDSVVGMATYRVQSSPGAAVVQWFNQYVDVTSFLVIGKTSVTIDRWIHEELQPYTVQLTVAKLL